MDIQALFELSIFMSFVAFGLVTKLYIWPRLRILERVRRSRGIRRFGCSDTRSRGCHYTSRRASAATCSCGCLICGARPTFCLRFTKGCSGPSLTPGCSAPRSSFQRR